MNIVRFERSVSSHIDIMSLMEYINIHYNDIFREFHQIIDNPNYNTELVPNFVQK